MRWLPFIILLSVAMFISSSPLLDFIAFGDYNIKPNFMLIVLIFFAISCDPAEAIASSFTIGLAADICSPSMAIGPHMVSFGIIGTAASFLQQQVIMKRLIYQAMCIFAAGLLALTMSEAMVFSKLSGNTHNNFKVIAMVTLYSAILGPFIWLMLRPLLKYMVVELPHYTRMQNR